MQRLALVLAVLLASAMTGCTFFNRGDGSSESQEPLDVPGHKSEMPARGSFEAIVVDNRFTPGEAWVTENTTVHFTNGASGTHSAIAEGGAFNTGGITPQSSVPVFFEKKGDYPYKCGYHSDMTGVIHVV